jgi:hypothetical protein
MMGDYFFRLEAESETSSFTKLWLASYVAVKKLCNFQADAEAEAMTLRIHLFIQRVCSFEIRFKEPLLICFWNSDALVLNFNNYDLLGVRDEFLLKYDFNYW